MKDLEGEVAKLTGGTFFGEMPWAKFSKDDAREAERRLLEAGVTPKMLELILERRDVAMTDCDSLTHGAKGSRGMSESVNQRIAEINRELSNLADSSNLKPEVRQALGIPEMGNRT